MNNTVRTTISLNEVMMGQMKEYGRKRGCQSFSEIVRDIVRTVLSPELSKQDYNKAGHNIKREDLDNISHG